jgi:3-oxoacyl-[acyl-carrier protein] reductase
MMSKPAIDEAPPSAIVTGGSRGIGFGMAELLVGRGWSVTLTARRVDQLEQAANQLTEHGGRVQIVAGDMADDNAITDVLEQHEAVFGGLSAVVLAAGVGSAGELGGYPASRWDKQFAVNVRAPFALVSQAIPALRRSAGNSPGGCSRVIAIASIEGIHPERGLSAYGASKAALISLVRSINLEENRNGILATAISPAFVATELSAWTTDTIAFDQMIAVDDVVKVVDLVLSLSPNASIPHIVINRVGAGPYHA